MAAPPKVRARRRRRVARAVALSEQGLTRPEIAARLGIAHVTVSGYLRDPDGKKGRAYRAGRTGVCESCGGTTSNPAKTTCADCARARGPGPRRLWTKETVVAAIKAWVLTYGAPPRISDWGGANATPEQRARYQRLRLGRTHNKTAGRVPSAATAITLFGTWGAAIRAAGYTPQPSGGGAGSLKTACAKGHEFTRENTYRYPSGRRGCRICRRRFSKRYKKKNRKLMTPQQRSESARRSALARYAGR